MWVCVCTLVWYFMSYCLILFWVELFFLKDRGKYEAVLVARLGRLCEDLKQGKEYDQNVLYEKLNNSRKYQNRRKNVYIFEIIFSIKCFSNIYSIEGCDTCRSMRKSDP